MQYNRARADDRARADRYSVFNLCADPDPTAAANEDVAAEINSRTDVYAVLDHAFVIDAGARIDDHIRADAAAGIDNRSRDDNSSVSNLNSIGNRRTWMNGAGKCKSFFTSDVREVQTRSAVAYTDDQMLDPRFTQSIELLPAAEDQTTVKVRTLWIDVVYKPGDLVLTRQAHDVGDDERVPGSSPDDYSVGHTSTLRARSFTISVRLLLLTCSMR